MTASFEIDLSRDERGLLWALWHVYKSKTSGILRISGASSSRGELRKEIAFVRGEAMGIRSSFPQDSLRHYATKAGLKSLAPLWSESSSQMKSDELMQLALAKGLIQQTEITSILGGFFKDRLFNMLTLRRGKLIWKEIPELSEEAVHPEIVRLSESFEKSLWDAITELFDEAYCKSRFTPKSSQSFKLYGDFPLPLAPQQLRLWNSQKNRSLHISSVQGLLLTLAAAALEFDLVVWEGNVSEKWKKDLLDTQKRFQSADPFQILGVSEEATESEAKAKYLEFVKKFHPDRIPADLPEELRSLAELILAQVNEAYSVVSDPERRQELLAEKQLASQGGVKAIEEKVKAEFALEEAKMALKRRHFAKALDLLDSAYGYLAEDLEFQVERAYAQMMKASEDKQSDRSGFSSYHQIFDKAVELRPDYANAFYYKGILLRLEQDFDKALAYFDQAYHLDDKLQEALSEARVIRMRKDKEKSKSKSWFRKK